MHGQQNIKNNDVNFVKQIVLEAICSCEGKCTASGCLYN